MISFIRSTSDGNLLTTLRLRQQVGQRVLQFMGDAGDGRPQRRQLFRSEHLLLVLLQLFQDKAVLDRDGGLVGQHLQEVDVFFGILLVR
jgi:hypothetical protein